MVIGLLPSASDAALCLDNLAEADFPAKDTSLVMRTRSEVEAIANVSGALTGLSPEELAKELIRRGLSPEEAARYKEAVLGGGVFIAVSAGAAEAAAAEMLADAGAKAIRSVKDE